MFPVSGLQAQPSVRYEISLARRIEHLFTVKMEILGAPEEATELALPAWNALYQIRDFSQYLAGFQARDPAGQSLPVQRLDKQTWRVRNAGNRQFSVSYQLFADTPGPFDMQLNEEHAFINPAMLCLYMCRHLNTPVSVVFLGVPREWDFATSLPAGSARAEFTARDYDHLADCPVEIGAFEQREFRIGRNQRQVPVRIVWHAAPGGFDRNAFAALVRRIVEAETAVMDEVPFDRYVFIYHVGETGGGGMEHRDSTAIGLARAGLERDPAEMASVTAHEFFHLWNVKRIRPRVFDRMDYSREVHTRALWFSEGCTSHMATLALARAGIWDEERYRAEIAREIGTLQSRSGRSLQSAEDSSWETWFDKYAYYREPARSISYYNKGHLLGLMLDLKVRDLTGNERSFDDLMRMLNWWFAKRGVGFEEDDLERAASTLAETDLGDFFRNYVSGTAELPVNEYLAIAGWVYRDGRLADVQSPTERQLGIRRSLLSLRAGGRDIR